MDKDGEFKYSQIVYVELDAEYQTTSIFPNPTKGQLQIIGTAPIQSMEVYNAVGKLYLAEPGASLENTAIDVSGLASGLYFIKVYYADDSETIKFIKD